MKKIILFAFVLATFFLRLDAQNIVTLNINHKLGDEDFAIDQVAKNNMDNDFKITRLEYYISEISLIHDGGNETLMEDVYVLANAETNTEIELGEYDISSVEKIIFHIGVDPEHNHLDPSAYHGSHPLAPKSPSMHWGWTAGYRFVALEGYGGTSLNQLLQLHGLGDSNYFSTEIELDVIAEDNIVTINLDADYTKALEDISVDSGVIVHGENFQAKKCLENFRDFVFSPSSITSSINNIIEINKFYVFPNPVSNGFSTLKLDIKDSSNNYDLSITSLDGKQWDYLYNVKDDQTLDFTNKSSGMYLLNLVKDEKTILTKKVFVK